MARSQSVGALRPRSIVPAMLARLGGTHAEDGMSDFSAEEVRRLRMLLEEDAIRQVRILYSQYMDAAQIDDLGG